MVVGRYTPVNAVADQRLGVDVGVRVVVSGGRGFSFGN